MVNYHRSAGMDEAGRGPMLGPMVVCGVVFDPEGCRQLDSINIRDSKMVTPRRRFELYDEIQEIARGIATRSIPASEIDRKRKRGISLNLIEAAAFGSILRELEPDVVYIDAADVNPRRFGETVFRLSDLRPGQCKVVSEHKADERYKVVAAASIIAKVIRDRSIERLQTDFGDIGSGYPGDPKSICFVRECAKARKIPPFVRQSWESVRVIIEEFGGRQLKLDEI